MKKTIETLLKLIPASAKDKLVEAALEKYTYMDYIKKIKENPIATQVKPADRKHNSDLSRCDKFEDWMPKRNKKYIKAIELLTATV